MKLIVHELKAAGLSQTVVAPRNMILSAIRPHIYRHNLPTGTLAIEVRDALNTLIATSESITISTIGTKAFFHGYVRFLVDAYLKKGQSYSLKLVGTGYSFSEPAYVGWCNGYDLGKYDSTTVPADIYQSPLDLEIWERTEK
jgi:hypothetical protein